MKQCPACRTTYTDDTLAYCLSDGNTLIDLGEQQTVVHQGSGGGVRVDIPQTVQNAPQPTTQYATVSSGGGGGMKAFFIIAGVFAMVVLAVIGAAAIMYFNRDSVSGVTNSQSPTPAKNTSPTPDPNKDLRDQIANLEKQIADQKKGSSNANVPLKMPETSTTQTTARANSPGDGFLALRSLPSAQIGERIAKIPHGATVNIGGCGPVITPVKRSGRWCQASYNGMSGWVFDAYLTY
ncbi:MAG TPA: SH3 domain-containing protein [Pyrinomonadaceae bacterium]|nr:SH3 domain-containing protein [Pyrinomonadaceae bacterium]